MASWGGAGGEGGEDERGGPRPALGVGWPAHAARPGAGASAKRAPRRGSAEPRQPISSPAWKGVEKAMATGTTYQASMPKRGHAPVTTRWRSATVSLIAAMYPMANRYHRAPTRHMNMRRRSARTPVLPSARAVSQRATREGA